MATTTPIQAAAAMRPLTTHGGKLILIGAFLVVLALLHPLAVWSSLEPASEAACWIRHEFTFTFFLPLFFPIAAVLFARSVFLGPQFQLKPQERACSAVVFALLCLAALMQVYGDLQRTPIEPFALRTRVVVNEAGFQSRLSALVARERKALNDLPGGPELADALHDLSDQEAHLNHLYQWVKADPRWQGTAALSRVLHEDIAFGRKHLDLGTAAEKRKKAEDLARRQADVLEFYNLMVPAFTGIRDLSQRGAFAAWVTLALNATAAVILATIYWYLCMLGIFWRRIGQSPLDILMLAIGILLLFFPLRLYVEWYLNFYSLELALSHYAAFWFLAFTAVLVLVILLSVRTPGSTVLIFSGLSGLFALVSAVLSKLTPQVITAAAGGIESFDIVETAGLALVSFLAVLAVTFSALKGAPAIVSGRTENPIGNN